ncbi:hypothetical protein [Streptomyces sp. ATexAB-D23]|uniref:hypothetical protein n=1 Tax=unclassified Streptomyces TaxID=2593676 RepID=UPI0003630EBE|nr:hypothetical protein [Streptomyces sp. ATexAB-D23]MYY05444.1 hypothetical protein [Streptomyces sp. SID4913]
MHTVKHWFSDSLTGQGLLVLVLGVGLGALFRHDEHPGLWVVQGVLYTVVVMGALAVQRHRTSRATGAGPRAIAGLSRKIRHREVPRDPQERAVMRRLVDDQLGKIERGERWLPYWLGFMGLVAAGLLVLGAARGSLVYSLVVAALVAAFIPWILRMRRRALGLHHYMRAALRERG